MLLIILACARVHVVPPPEEVRMVAPESEPLPPFEAPRARAESMNTEYYLDSKVAEQAQFQSFSTQITAIQNKQSADREQAIQRGFHGKSHGCFEGEMVLREDRDLRTRYGIFAAAI